MVSRLKIYVRKGINMKKRSVIVFIAGLVIVIIAASCRCDPTNIASVQLTLVPQHRDCWCWAATTEMISMYYGHRVDQCLSANFVHGTPPDCCTGCTGTCPCWGWGWGASIADIQNNWTHWNFTYAYAGNSLSWEDLRHAVYCRKSPIQAVWWWSGGGGHVINVYGYAQTPVGNFVSYMNPWAPDCQCLSTGACSSTNGGEDAITTYSAFDNDGNHDWGNSFYNFYYVSPTPTP